MACLLNQRQCPLPRWITFTPFQHSRALFNKANINRRRHHQYERLIELGKIEMATLGVLKQALRQKAELTASSPKQPLSETQYRSGFDILTREPAWITYQDFIIPQLYQLLAPLFNCRTHVSVLEIGPDPKSVLISVCVI
jgi:hypothetical protein